MIISQLLRRAIQYVKLSLWRPNLGLYRVDFFGRLSAESEMTPEIFKLQRPI